MHVNMLGLGPDGKQYVMGVVRSDDGRLLISGDLSPSLREELAQLRNAAPGDFTFLRQLPRHYSGSHVRAQFVRE